MTIKIDTYTRVMLTVIAVLLTAVVGGLWFTTPSTVPAARAQDYLPPPTVGIPDQGAQLNAILVELQQLNLTSAQIAGILESGSLKVQIVESAPGDNGQIIAPPAAQLAPATPAVPVTPAVAKPAPAPAAEDAAAAPAVKPAAASMNN